MINITFDTRQTKRASLGLRGFREQLRRPVGIMRTVAEGVELQSRVRIHREKKAPDGRAWAPWSKSYARTRSGGHSLLKDTWAMVDRSFTNRATHTKAVVKNTRRHAGFIQDGTANKDGTIRMPARVFLGLSRRNADDLENWIAPLMADMFAEAVK